MQKNKEQEEYDKKEKERLQNNLKILKKKKKNLENTLNSLRKLEAILQYEEDPALKNTYYTFNDSIHKLQIDSTYLINKINTYAYKDTIPGTDIIFNFSDFIEKSKKVINEINKYDEKVAKNLGNCIDCLQKKCAELTLILKPPLRDIDIEIKKLSEAINRF